MLKHHFTYEIMRPHDVGLSRTNLVLGKHSGRHAFRERMKELGFELSDAELNRLFDEFKALADKKKQLVDGDIEALVMRSGNDVAGPWSLQSLSVATSVKQPARVTIALAHTDGPRTERVVLGQEGSNDERPMAHGAVSSGESSLRIRYRRRMLRGRLMQGV